MFGDIGKMMKEAQQLQARMAEAQEEIARIEATGTSGGGLVSVTMSGKGDLKSVKIAPKAVDPSDIEMLEDLIVAAVSDAKAKMEAAVAQETEKAMGGLKLPPGFNLPF